MFLLNLNCTNKTEESSVANSESDVRVKWWLNLTLNALNPDTAYPHLSLENVGNPPMAYGLLIAAAIVFALCLVQALVRGYILFSRNSNWREILYEEKRFHYGVSFLVILFFICLQGTCIYAYWMDFANAGYADRISEYFGHLFGALAHTASLLVIEMWVFGRTKPRSVNTSVSKSVEKAMGGKLNTFAVWCFLFVACMFYSFYESSTHGWPSLIMITAVAVWMVKPVLRIVEQVYEMMEGARPAEEQEQKKLITEDGEEKEEADIDAVPAAKPGSKQTLWKSRVMPFFANPWPIIFIIFGLCEIFWICLPNVLPWYLA